MASVIIYKKPRNGYAKWRRPQLSISERMRIDSAPFEKLHSWHNRGYNGHPDFWFHVDKVIQAKYPSDNPQFKFQAPRFLA